MAVHTQHTIDIHDIPVYYKQIVLYCCWVCCYILIIDSNVIPFCCIVSNFVDFQFSRKSCSYVNSLLGRTPHFWNFNETRCCGGKLSSKSNETGKSGVSSSFPNVSISDTLHMEEPAAQLYDQDLIFPFNDESNSVISKSQGKVMKKKNWQKLVG